MHITTTATLVFVCVAIYIYCDWSWGDYQWTQRADDERKNKAYAKA